DVPFGIPSEPIPVGASRSGGGSAFTAPLFGLDQWCKVFTPRQLMALGTFVKHTRAARDQIRQAGYPQEWAEAIASYLACAFDRMLDFNSSCLSWITSVEAIGHTFVRYALPITWDYSESAPINYVRGGWRMCFEATCESLATVQRAQSGDAPSPSVVA